MTLIKISTGLALLSFALFVWPVDVSASSFIEYFKYLGTQKEETASIPPAPVKKKQKTIRPEYQFTRSPHFPYPAELRPQVEFWKSIYSRYTTSQAVIHDSEHLDIVYDVVDLTKAFKRPNPSYYKVRRYMKKRRRDVAQILKKLHRSKGNAKNKKELEIAGKLARFTDRSKYLKASRRVRSQLGQADRFREGIVRSGMYLKQMKEIFRSYGVPLGLTALPHVESSFNYEAYSNAGAAGVWQFTRSTGRLFMKVNYIIDERRDPILSTHAAAKLLKENYEKLASWPLAITAYNHGPNGMARAKKRHGDDIVQIIKKYKSRNFGFASRNFYAEFLAALDVAGHYKKHFGDIKFLPEQQYDEVILGDYVSAKTITRQLKLGQDILEPYNRSLRKSVWKGHRRVPSGFRLRVPKGLGGEAALALSAIPASYKYSSQKYSGFYIVSRGDTLSTIARRRRSSVRAIKEINGLRSNMIRVGQRLRVPSKSASKQKARSTKARITEASYKIRRGDSLSSISKRANMTVAQLAALNSISRRATIFPGQKIMIRMAALVKPEGKRESGKIVNGVAGHSAPKKTNGVKPAVVVNDKPVSNNSQAAIPSGPVNLGSGLYVDPVVFTVSAISDKVAQLVVRSEETMGHYADWARVSLRKLKRLNPRISSRNVRIGASIKIPLERVSLEKFQRKRVEYHMQLFEDFFDVYRVDDKKVVSVKRGQSLWDLCVNDYGAPIWLVRLYNPSVKLAGLHPGDNITIPSISKKIAAQLQ